MSTLKDMTEPEMKRGKKSESEREGNEDRLSELPDCLVLHILSFVQCKDAVRTCVLSPRWKKIWERLPTLVLHSSDFKTVRIFGKFVTKLLSLCDGSVALHTLDFQRHGCVESRLLRRVISYAISHNVQQLRIHTTADIYQLPPSIFSCIFSCQSLTSLKLSIFRKSLYGRKSLCGGGIIFPEFLNLPALTSLYLENIAFCGGDNDQAEPFSTLNSLNNLVIHNCTLRDARILCISSNTLSSLTIYSTSLDYYKIVLSAPNLSSFAFKGAPSHHLSGSSLSSLQQVNIDAGTFIHHAKQRLIMLNWLKELANVKSLTVTPNTLQILFLIPDILNIKLPSLGKLRSLKVKMKSLSFIFAKPQRPTVPDGIVDFLLQNSPSAKVFIKCGFNFVNRDS